MRVLKQTSLEKLVAKEFFWILKWTWQQCQIAYTIPGWWCVPHRHTRFLGSHQNVRRRHTGLYGETDYWTETIHAHSSYNIDISVTLNSNRIRRHNVL